MSQHGEDNKMLLLRQLLSCGPVRAEICRQISRKDIYSLGVFTSIQFGAVDFAYSEETVCQEWILVRRDPLTLPQPDNNAGMWWPQGFDHPGNTYRSCGNGRGYLRAITSCPGGTCEGEEGPGVGILVCDDCLDRTRDEWVMRHEQYLLGVCTPCAGLATKNPDALPIQVRRGHCNCPGWLLNQQDLLRTCRRCLLANGRIVLERARVVDTINTWRTRKWIPSRPVGSTRRPWGQHRSATMSLWRREAVGGRLVRDTRTVTTAYNGGLTRFPGRYTHPLLREGGVLADAPLNVPHCPCGRPAHHSRRGSGNKVRVCASCITIVVR